MLVACNNDSTETTTTQTTINYTRPEIADFNEVFYGMDSYDITYGDMYDSLIINDGINQLLAMVDNDLLATEIASVTQAEIDEKILELTYGTTDEDIIDSFGEDRVQKLTQNYEDNMYLMGFGDNHEGYLRLLIAREKIARAMITDETNNEETWYVGPEQIADYYADNYFQDRSFIKIKFYSSADAQDVMNKFNLKSRNQEIILYTGDKPIEDVASYELDETNTRSLSEAELLEKFIEIYNYVYEGRKTLLDTNAGLGELLGVTELKTDYQDIKDYNKSLADFLFETLSAYGTDGYYTYKPVKYYSNSDKAYYLIMNLSATEEVELSDFSGDKVALENLITSEIYSEIETDLVEVQMSSQAFVTRRMAEYRSQNDFEIYDFYLATDYAYRYDNAYEMPEVSNVNILAGYGSKTISHTELLAYALERNPGIYLMYSAQNKEVINNHFEKLYCDEEDVCETDYLENESVLMMDHLAAYVEMRTNYQTSQYVDIYSFEEYRYLAYGTMSESDTIFNYYVMKALQPIFIFDKVYNDDYEILQNIIQMLEPYYDNYFSLKATHLLIYVDFDEDGAADDYSEFFDELVDKQAYETLLEGFETEIRNYLALEDNSFATLVETYYEADRDDEVWGEYKRYGFYIMTENLSSKGDLTYVNSIDKFEDSFTLALIDIYQDYRLEENSSKDYIMNDNLVETSYGKHIVRAEKGVNFDFPSAVVAANEEDDRLNNSEQKISFSQLQVLLEQYFIESVNENLDYETLYDITEIELPETLETAYQVFGEDFVKALFVVGYLNVNVIENIKTGDYINTNTELVTVDETTLMSYMDDISEIYMRQVFVELDKR
jgi:hypothetical protein